MAQPAQSGHFDLRRFFRRGRQRADALNKALAAQGDSRRGTLKGANPDFSRVVYCGAAIIRPDCVALCRPAPLKEGEFVISADEKTSIQARRRRHDSLPPQPGSPSKVEHEYERLGKWAYLAAWDVHAAKLFGRCEAKTGIAPFGRLVEQVMSQNPIARPGGSSGSSTTALPIADRPLSGG